MIDPFLMTIVITVVAGIVIVIAIMLGWLIRTYLKLKYEYQVLSDTARKYGDDIAGLSASRQTVDERITFTNEQMGLLSAKISDLYAAKQMMDKRITDKEEQISALNAKYSTYQHNEHSNSTNSYGAAIQKVRNGASVSDLMQNSGLSQDEAALLIRLHGSSSRL
jgi:hypothetical protein